MVQIIKSRDVTKADVPSAKTRKTDTLGIDTVVLMYPGVHIPQFQNVEVPG